MSEIEILVTPTAALDMAGFQALLWEFETQSGISVRLKQIETNSIRKELHRSITANQGADLTQLGSSWLRGMVDMNALRPFTSAEVKSIGQAEDFIPAFWESALIGDISGQWAIPWLADIRLLYYRKDLFEQAGIDDKNAFESPEALENTLEQLQVKGIENPWVIPTRFSWQTIHNVASWLWGVGSTFLNPDGTKVKFDTPNAIKGITSYFRLAKYLSPKHQRLNADESEKVFLKGDAAVTMSRYCLALIPDKLKWKVGIAVPPGIPFVGGSHLVILKYSYKADEAVELIRFLTSTHAQLASGGGHLVPARMDALKSFQYPSEFKNDFPRVLDEILEKGRSFRPAYLWDNVEMRLVTTMASIWEDIFTMQNPNIDEIVESHLTFLSSRINLILGN